MKKNEKFVFDESKGIREMTMEEIDQIVATGPYTVKELPESEFDVKIRETKSILKMLHLV